MKYVENLQLVVDVSAKLPVPINVYTFQLRTEKYKK